MAKATNDQLNELHGLLCKHYKKLLDGGDVSAAELAVIVKFLKDNNIEADLDQAPALGDIKDRLPFTSAADPVHH